MKVALLYIGKTQQPFVREGFAMYKKRIVHYTHFEEIQVDDVKNPKNLSVKQLKEQEGEKILKKINSTDFVVLLDEKGRSFNSLQFAQWVENKMLQSTKKILFVVGGAFGFSDAVYQRANSKICLSAMTFSHQIIRVIFAEQIYRAFTIIKGESYHNE